MSANSISTTLFHAANLTPDPGNAGTITAQKSLAVCNLVSAAAETRTLDRPTRQGTVLTLHHYTDGGDITLTVTGGYDEAGTTTFVFSDPGQFLTLISLYDGTNYYWRSIADHNTGSSSSGSFTSGTITFVANANMVANATNGTMFGTNANQKVSLWGVQPVVQPSAQGSTVGINGNAATNGNANATNFNCNGNFGNTFYTQNDVVYALKKVGILPV